jgi:hypothetical protein
MTFKEPPNRNLGGLDPNAFEEPPLKNNQGQIAFSSVEL